MKKNNTLVAFLAAPLIISFFLSSCCLPCTPQAATYIVKEDRQKENIYYIPAAPNAPLLTKKNNLYFDVKRSSGDKFSAFETQAAYMISKNIGISADFSSGLNKASEDSMGRSNYMNYHRLEAAAGYVTKIGRQWHFETYAGMGKEVINNQHHTGSSKVGIPYFFVQPAIAVSNSKQTVQLGFSSRFTGARFKVTDISFDTAREPFSAAEIGSLSDQPFHVMWEPGLVFRVGWENVLFHTSYAYAADLTNPDLYRAKSNFSIGLAFRFNTHQRY